MNKNIARLMIFTLFVFVIVIIISSMPSETKKLDMRLKVDSYSGFNVDTKLLDFGTTAPSGAVTKTVILTNGPAASRQVYITVQGSLLAWTEISESSLIMAPNQTKEISVTVTVPPNAEYGNYSGTLIIKFKDLIN